MSKVVPEQHPTVPAALYSSRVVSLKTVVEPGEGGAHGLVGRRVLVGGWVRSSKEVIKKETLSSPVPDHRVSGGAATTEALATRDVSCSEILQTKIPFIRSIIKILGGGSSYPARDKTDNVGGPQPLTVKPSTAFLQVSDGSCATSLLVVVDSSIVPPSQLLPTGTCIVAEGELKESTFDHKHAVELVVEKILHIGPVESDKYPLSKKRLPLNSLRDFPHFRSRTTTVATVMRIRSALSLGAHMFPQSQGFHSVQLPIITATNSELHQGFTDQRFHVITATAFNEEAKTTKPKSSPDDISLEVVRSAVKEKSKIVEDLKRTESNNEALVAATRDLQKTLDLASQLEEREKSRSKSFDDEYFSRQAHLTLSGRLHLESYACCLGKVYDFGPRFRATRKDLQKQVAEMWTVEMEMAFSELEDAMNCAEDFFKFLCKWVLEKCSEDMKFVMKRMDRTSVDRLYSITSHSFERITYTEAVDVLKKVMDSKKIEKKIEWGVALTCEHLSFLAEEVYKKPVFIYNYPKQVNPFYTRLNDDRRTVAAFDMVVPKLGVLASGSQNEERLNMLSGRIKELGLSGEEYEWYLDLRRHGTVKHGGFSFAFDLMVLFATGLADVRDVIPFPRTCGKIIN